MSLLVPPRAPSHELLDAGVPAAEAEKSLGDMEWVHRRLGGRRALARGLLPLLNGSGGLVLDLGCGSGHVARDLARAGHRAAALDRRAEHVRLAPRGLALAGDAARLPFADRSVDVVLSTLLLHHFSPAALRALLLESARVARRAVVAFDLARHRAPLALVSLLGPLVFKTRVSVADGRASVRQAYTPAEAAALALEVLPGAEVTRAGPFVWRLLWRKS